MSGERQVENEESSKLRALELDSLPDTLPDTLPDYNDCDCGKQVCYTECVCQKWSLYIQHADCGCDRYCDVKPRKAYYHFRVNDQSLAVKRAKALAVKRFFPNHYIMKISISEPNNEECNGSSWGVRPHWGINILLEKVSMTKEEESKMKSPAVWDGYHNYASVLSSSLPFDGITGLIDIVNEFAPFIDWNQMMSLILSELSTLNAHNGGWGCGEEYYFHHSYEKLPMMRSSSRTLQPNTIEPKEYAGNSEFLWSEDQKDVTLMHYVPVAVSMTSFIQNWDLLLMNPRNTIVNKKYEGTTSWTEKRSVVEDVKQFLIIAQKAFKLQVFYGVAESQDLAEREWNFVLCNDDGFATIYLRFYVIKTHMLVSHKGEKDPNPGENWIPVTGDDQFKFT